MTDVDKAHLMVESGPEQGRHITVPTNGVNIGREPTCDIILADDTLSREHCRFFFKDHQLHIADLGSTNETLVNNKPIADSLLRIGDRIEIGESILVIKQVSETGAPPPVPRGSGPEVARAVPPPAAARAPLTMVILGVLGTVVLMVIVMVLRKASTPTPVPQQIERQIEIEYERVEATQDQIRRYELTLKDKVLTERAEVARGDEGVLLREVTLSDQAAERLAAELNQAGFFNLKESYQGLVTDVWDAWDLSVTIGYTTHRVKVVNRLEPEPFRLAREALEGVAKQSLAAGVDP